MAKVLGVQKPYAMFTQKVLRWPIFYGSGRYGGFWYGGLDFCSGIYQLRKCHEGKLSIQIQFYPYVITHELGQQTRREKFADAVVGWQGLTDEEKNTYRERARYKKFSGYNLYLREYLLS